MKAARCGLVAAWLVALSTPSPAQGPPIRFGQVTVEDGLSNAWVQAILKDSRGFLWFGTQDGLNRYDGASIKVYRHDPQDSGSLPSSVAAVLLEDRKKRLWVGSGWGDAGLALYDRAHDRFVRFMPRPGLAGGNNVRAMAEDRQGRLWIGTDNGISRFDPERGVFERFPLVADDRSGAPEGIVTALHEDPQGRLWVGTLAGLLQFDRSQGQYRRWPGPGDDPAGLDRAEIWDFHDEEGAALWIATSGGGLHRLEVDAGRDIRYLPDARDPDSIAQTRLRRIVPDGKGRLYLAMENAGLDIFDPRSRKFTHIRPDPADPSRLNSGSIWCAYRDDQDILWIGTFNAGVNFISPANQRFQHLKSSPGGLNDAHVSAVMEDHLGNLWIGTDGGGLNRRDGKTGTFTYYRHSDARTTLGSDAVWALMEDRQRNLWVGGWDAGLGLLDPLSGRVTRFLHDPADPKSIASNHVWRIVELESGELLIATHAGADVYDPKARVFTHLRDRYPGANEGVVYSVAEGRDGNLWLAGVGPVAEVNRRTGKITQYRSDPGTLGFGWTQALLVDRAGNVWLGTQGGLVCLSAGTKAMRRYTVADGLPDNTITNMQEDEQGNLWLGTNRGLSQLMNAVQIPGHPVFVNFDVQDGLQGNEFARNASFRGRRGEMFFGGSRGLNSFRPDQTERNPHAPPVVLTDLKLFNKSAAVGAPGSPLERAIPEASELTLSHRHSMVTFEFAALNFVVPQKNQYAYKLEGFDESWNEVGTQHSATYTNVPPGTFTLRVRASNNDGVWNHEGVSLKIRVTPPFWGTLPFRLAMVLATLALVLAGHRLRVRRLRAHARELAAKIEESTADLRREVAERRRAEEELRQMAEGLDARVRERTAQVETVNAELETRNAELERFTYTVSHDLKSPLLTIRSYADFILKDVGSGRHDRLARDSARIVEATERMRRLLDDLLELSRVGRVTNPPTDVSLGDLAREAAELVHGRLEAKGATLVIDPGLPSVRADRARLLEVLQNLLDNAAKFGGDREPLRIEVGWRPGPPPVFYVRDNGAGIDARYHQKIFGLFERLEPGGDGTGVGLALAKRIVEVHGGQIWVESEGAGKGATFCFTLGARAGGPDRG